MSYRPAALAAAVAASLAIAGCGSESPPKGKATIRVTERDFRISVPKRLPAGENLLAVRNKGPVRHELIVIRKRDGELPMRRDGLTVDEDAVEPLEADALEPGTSGQTRSLRVSLRPGKYEFICNMAGHYLGGMEKDVVVG